MAKDVITRFKLETTQYDSKLRDASKGMAELAKTATAAGKEFDKYTKANVEAAKALGNITPSANNAKDKVKELVTAYNDLAKAYNALTKEQQSSDFGKAMAESMGKLKTQIAAAKQELYGMGDAMKEMTSGSSGFTNMLAVFGGNMLTKGVSMLTSELVGSVQESIELAKQGEGVRMAFERINKPGLLENLKEATHGTVSELELMKQAVKFENFKLSLDQMGTFLAFAQQQAKDTGQSVDYMVDSIVTGLGRKSLPILDNLGLSAAEIRERMKESGDMTTAVASIIKDRMEAAGGYVETAADRAARATAKAQDAAEAFGRNAIPIAQEWAETWATLSQGAMTFANTLLGPVARSIRSIQGILNSDPMDRITGSKYNLFNGYQNPTPNTGLPNQRVTAPGGYVVVTDKNGKEIGAKHFDDLSGVDAWRNGLTTKSTRRSGGSRGRSQQTELQQNQARINTLTQEYVRLGDESTEAARQRQEEIQKEIALLEKRNGQLKLYQEQAKGKLLGPDTFRQQLSVDVAVNNKKIEELEKQLLSLDGITIDPKTVKVTAETDEARQKVEELKRQIAELKDQNLMINAGMASLDLQNAQDLSRTGGLTGFVGVGKDMMPIEGLPSMSEVVRQRGGNLLDDKAMKAVNDGIYGDTGKKGEKNSAKSLLNGISQLTDGLQKIGIDIPEEVQAVIGVIQGMMQVIEAVNTIIGVTQTTALTANTAAIISLETAIWANTASSIIPFANGGVVRAAGGTVVGNTYSGDQIPALLNAGEVVLNRSQVSTLASSLQGGGLNGLSLYTEISMEKLRIGLNNNSRRKGKGEYVTSNKY